MKPRYISVVQPQARGGTQSGEGGSHSGRGGSPSGRGGGRGGSQSDGGRSHCYAFLGSPETEALDAVITGLFRFVIDQLLYYLFQALHILMCPHILLLL